MAFDGSLPELFQLGLYPLFCPPWRTSEEHNMRLYNSTRNFEAAAWSLPQPSTFFHPQQTFKSWHMAHQNLVIQPPPPCPHHPLPPPRRPLPPVYGVRQTARFAAKAQKLKEIPKAPPCLPPPHRLLSGQLPSGKTLSLLLASTDACTVAQHITAFPPRQERALARHHPARYRPTCEAERSQVNARPRCSQADTSQGRLTRLHADLCYSPVLMRGTIIPSCSSLGIRKAQTRAGLVERNSFLSISRLPACIFPTQGRPLPASQE